MTVHVGNPLSSGLVSPPALVKRLNTADLGIAVPTFFNPNPLESGMPNDWDRLLAFASSVGIVVLNPDSGPGLASFASGLTGGHQAWFDGYLRELGRGVARGIAVLGYVPTDHGNRPQTDVEADIKAYYTLWQTDPPSAEHMVSGIFFDEVPTARGTNDVNYRYYEALSTYAIQMAVDTMETLGIPTVAPLIVLNPGTYNATSQWHLDMCDIVATFESYYEVGTLPNAGYIDKYPGNTAFSIPADDWTRYGPHGRERFWHLIHGAPNAATLLTAFALSRARNAGWIYVTDRDLAANVWQHLPIYWNDEVAALQ